MAGTEIPGGGERGRLYLTLTVTAKRSSRAVRKSRWLSWAPVPNKSKVSAEVKPHSTVHHRQNDSCIKLGSGESHFNVSLTAIEGQTHKTVYANCHL